MKTLRLPGQFIYDALVIPPRKRTERRMWLHGTTAYDIVSVERSKDPVGELRYTVGVREDMGSAEVAALPQYKLVEYGGRLWRQGGYEALGVEEYAEFLRDWASDRRSRTGVEQIMMDPVVMDPIAHFERPQHRRLWLRMRHDDSVWEKSHIGRIARSDRQAYEAQYQAVAEDVLFVDGVLHYPAAAPVWQCCDDGERKWVELVEVHFTDAGASAMERYVPKPSIGQEVYWLSAFAVDRLEDAKAFSATDGTGRVPSVRGRIEAMPAGFAAVSPFAYCVCEAFDRDVLEPLEKLTHLLSADAFAAWHRLAEAQYGRRRFSLGRIAADPVAAAKDLALIHGELDGRFLSAADEEAFSSFRYRADTALRRLEFEKSLAVVDARDDEALASFAK